MTVTFFKSDAAAAEFPDEEDEKVVDIPENAQLTYYSLRDTKTGDDFAYYDAVVGYWFKSDDKTHWSDIVIGDSRV